MSGYEKSPDYGDSERKRPAWIDWAALIIFLGTLGGLAWYGLTH